MFSGIVEEVGNVIDIVESAQGQCLKIAACTVMTGLKLGDSIAVAGACLTVVDFGTDWFRVEATLETLRKTKLGQLKQKSKVNLERALRLADRLGGHLVSGHIDGLAKIVSIRQEGFSKIIEFVVPAVLSPYFIEKGSVAIDGVSLTVASLQSKEARAHPGLETRFTVAVIPHTLAMTTLAEVKTGDSVNIETDLIGKYVARFLSNGQNINKAGVTMSLLSEHGYT